jgi:hypothetical protein
MTVPSEATLHLAPTHRLVSRNRIFDETCEEMSVVRQSVGKRWPVIKHELIRTTVTRTTCVDAASERAFAFPASQDCLFERRKVRLRIDVGVGHGEKA